MSQQRVPGSAIIEQGLFAFLTAEFGRFAHSSAKHQAYVAQLDDLGAGQVHDARGALRMLQGG